MPGRDYSLDDLQGLIGLWVEAAFVEIIRESDQGRGADPTIPRPVQDQHANLTTPEP